MEASHASFCKPRVYQVDKQGGQQTCQTHISELILDGMAKAKDRFDIVSTTPSSCFSGVCDLRTMKMTDSATGDVFGVIIEFPWDPKALIFVVSQARDSSLRRKVLTMALDRIRSQSVLKNVLTRKGLPNCGIRVNPFLRRGHLPYDTFMDSLVNVFESESRGAKLLFEKFVWSAHEEADYGVLDSVENGGIRIVFHGTNHDVMEAILKSGLDPTYRVATDGDYFGTDYHVSLQYTTSKTTYKPNPWLPRLLVFMVLHASLDNVERGFITVQDNKHQLPLAEITL